MKVATACTALCIIFWSCSGHERSEKDKLKQHHAKTAVIHRKSQEVHYELPVLKRVMRRQYLWEANLSGGFPKITKEFFRCMGDPVNPWRKIFDEKGNVVEIADCSGKEKHSLPLRNNEEFIYPILLDLLNFIQSKAQKQVVITCGHRCPKHNTYADLDKNYRTSKHLIGAEVDFYVRGWEYKPENVLTMIQQYYQSEDDPGYRIFQRDYESQGELRVALWCNHEISIKIYQRDEGRDLDNQHPYPYLSIQVRFDRKENKPVHFNWDKAYKGYLQW